MKKNLFAISITALLLIVILMLTSREGRTTGDESSKINPSSLKSNVTQKVKKELNEEEAGKKIAEIVKRTELDNDLLRYASAIEISQLGKPALKPILEMLRDEDKYKRALAAETLGEMRDKSATEPLMGMLEDKETIVRLKAIESLGLLESKEAAVKLIPLIEDKDVEIAGTAAVALGKMKSKEAVAPLIKALKDRDRVYAVIEALSNIGDERAIEPVIKTFAKMNDRVLWYVCKDVIKFGKPLIPYCIKGLEDDNEYVRLGCFMLLGELKEPSTIKPMIKAVDRLGFFMLDCGPFYLAMFDDPASREEILKAMKKSSGEKEFVFATALGLMGDERVIDSLVNNLKISLSYSPRADVRALGKIGKPAVEPLIKYLRENDDYSVTGAVEALERIGDRRAAGPLLEKLKADGYVSEFYYYNALVKIGGNEAVPFMIKTLKDKKSKERDSAAEYLGKSGDVRAIKPLIAALYDKDKYLRYRVIEALGRIGGPEAKKALMGYLNSVTAEEPLEAVVGLSLLDDESTFGPIKKKLRESLEEDKREIIDNDSKSKDKKYDYLNWMLVKSLCRYKGQAEKLFLELKDDDNPIVRLFAGEGLYYLDSASSEKALEEGAKKGDVALIAGGYIYFIEKGDEANIPILLRTYNNYYNQGMAVFFIGSGNEKLMKGMQLCTYRKKGPHVCFHCARAGARRAKVPKWGKKWKREKE